MPGTQQQVKTVSKLLKLISQGGSIIAQQNSNFVNLGNNQIPIMSPLTIGSGQNQQEFNILAFSGGHILNNQRTNSSGIKIIIPKDKLSDIIKNQGGRIDSQFFGKIKPSSFFKILQSNNNVNGVVIAPSSLEMFLDIIDYLNSKFSGNTFNNLQVPVGLPLNSIPVGVYTGTISYQNNTYKLYFAGQELDNLKKKFAALLLVSILYKYLGGNANTDINSIKNHFNNLNQVILEGNTYKIELGNNVINSVKQIVNGLNATLYGTLVNNLISFLGTYEEGKWKKLNDLIANVYEANKDLNDNWWTNIQVVQLNAGGVTQQGTAPQGQQTQQGTTAPPQTQTQPQQNRQTTQVTQPPTTQQRQQGQQAPPTRQTQQGQYLIKPTNILLEVVGPQNLNTKVLYNPATVNHPDIFSLLNNLNDLEEKLRNMIEREVIGVIEEYIVDVTENNNEFNTLTAALVSILAKYGKDEQRNKIDHVYNTLINAFDQAINGNYNEFDINIDNETYKIHIPPYVAKKDLIVATLFKMLVKEHNWAIDKI